MAGPVTRGVAEAAALLAAGRDLMRTHVGTRPDGCPLGRSEWAGVLTSVPVARALLLEMASWARHVAPAGGQLATAPRPVRGSAGARRRVNAACQQLCGCWTGRSRPHEHDPVRAGERRLLRAIPVNAVEPRRQPDGAQAVDRLCQAVISTAERVRRAARSAVPRAAWSPALTTESLREAAACATVISHNCHVLRATLAACAEAGGPAGLRRQLAAAAEAARNARQAWLKAAQQWRSVTTDTLGAISLTAAEAQDLALWTGHLAYDDPAWTPQQGPSRAVRPASGLAPEPASLTDVIAAVHHACETLTQLAEAEHAQITAAHRAGRLLVPTRSLPSSYDIPYRFAPAPHTYAEPLLSAYQDAATASDQLTAAVAQAAATVRSPSRFLTAARHAAHGASPPTAGAARHDAAAEPDPTRHPTAELRPPGPVERILHDLGVTSPDVIARAIAIDQEAGQLILDNAPPASPSRANAGRRDPSRSPGTAELINHLLAYNGGRDDAAALLPTVRREAEAEIEP